jgi:hypothetical protein
MGNLPFGGMVKASYLAAEDWRRLAATPGYRIDRQIGGAYRSGNFERLFPNRLEVTMRWVCAYAGDAAHAAAPKPPHPLLGRRPQSGSSRSERT